MKNGLMIGAFSLLSVVAAVGWTRKPTPQPVDLTSQQFAAQPAIYNSGAPAVNSGEPSGFQQSAIYNSGAPAVNSGEPSGFQPAYHNATPAPRPAVRHAYSDRTYATRTYVKPRSTKRSVAIVAGSSGVGAAIGALAGGGRGAGIGALAGGGAGFIYDRLTHNHPQLF
jgi:hypothetical protein